MTRAWLLRRLAGDARRHVVVWLAIAAAFAVVGFSAAGARLAGVGRRVPAPAPPAARVVAYLEDGLSLSSSAAVELQRVLATLPGVEAVRPMSPRESLDLLRRELGPRADVIAGVGSDLLPSSLEIVARPSEAEALAFRMRRLRGVADADFVPAPARSVPAPADAGGRLRLGVALVGALGLLAAAAALALLRARVRVELGLWLALGLPRAASARPAFWLASLAAVLGAALGVVGAICAWRAWLGTPAPPLPAREIAAGAAFLLMATLGVSRLALRVPEVAGA